jgi:Zn-dependent alcohol dehydrogenase
VKEVGPNVTIANPGDPILLSYAYCNNCQLCSHGHTSHCVRFNEINFGYRDETFKTSLNEAESKTAAIAGSFFGQSSFARMSIVKERSVVNVKDLVKSKQELELYAPLGCGFQTGSGTAINVADIQSTDILCVTGLGSVGMSAIMGAKIRGCETIIGIDRVQSRLDLAEELGATMVIHSDELADASLVNVVRGLAEGIGPTVCIETTGVPALIQDALQFTRPMGMIIQIGAAPFDFKLGIDVFQWMVEGKRYIGAVEGHALPATYVPQMIKWHKEGKFPIERLIKRFAANDYEMAIQEMHHGSTIKPVLCWSDIE